MRRVVGSAAEPAARTVLRAGGRHGLEEEHGARRTRVKLGVVAEREVGHGDDTLLDPVEVDADRPSGGSALRVRQRVRRFGILRRVSRVRASTRCGGRAVGTARNLATRLARRRDRRALPSSLSGRSGDESAFESTIR
jgi:hypothetical protein